MAIFQNILSSRNNKPTANIQLRFLKQLFKLLNNGYSLIDSLNVIQWDNELKQISNKIIVKLKNGTSLSTSFEQLHFHHSITAYLSFVETSGDLKFHIDKCIMMYEQRLTYSKKLNQIMRYPLMLIIIFSILLLSINQFVLPSFLDLFHTNAQSSKTIIYLINIISYLGKLVIFICVLVIFIWFVGRIVLKKSPIRKQISLYSKIPFYSSFKTLYTSFIFATHISTLLNSGMSIKQIFQYMAEQQKHPIISYYSSLLIGEFKRGRQIDHLFTTLPLIDQQFAVIFQKNNNMTDLEKDLTMFADMLLDEFHRKMMNFIVMVQPIFFTIIAFFIIFIYLAIMWPMFDLIKTI